MSSSAPSPVLPAPFVSTAATRSAASFHRRGRWAGRIFVLFISAIMSMTVVVSIAPAGDAVVAAVHCRGGELSTTKVSEGYVQGPSGSRKGVASISGTCTRDGVVTPLSGDMIAVTSILGGAAIGAVLAAGAMVISALRRAIRRSHHTLVGHGATGASLS